MNSLKIGKSYALPKKINGNCLLQQLVRNAASDIEDPGRHIQKGIYGETPVAEGPSKPNASASNIMSNLSKKMPKNLPDLASTLSGAGGGTGSSGGGLAGLGGVVLSERAMAFPYTFSAKIAQFPLRFYIANQWIWKYYFIALIVCLPIFYKISRMANSKENKEKWAELKRRELEAYEHHDDD